MKRVAARWCELALAQAGNKLILLCRSCSIQAMARSHEAHQAAEAIDCVKAARRKVRDDTRPDKRRKTNPDVKGITLKALYEPASR